MIKQMVKENEDTTNFCVLWEHIIEETGFTDNDGLQNYKYYLLD